jgi:hypothetical protein
MTSRTLTRARTEAFEPSRSDDGDEVTIKPVNQISGCHTEREKKNSLSRKKELIVTIVTLRSKNVTKGLF